MGNLRLSNHVSLESALRRSGSPAPAHGEALTIGTLIFIAVIIIYVSLWGFRWRNISPDSKYFWWNWLGWGIVVAASVYAVLWAIYYLGSDSLSWTVPSLAAIEIPLYVLWYSQRDKLEVRMSSPSPNNSEPDAKKIPNHDDAAVLRLRSVPDPVPSGEALTTTAAPNTGLTLADLRNVIDIVAARLRGQGQVDSVISVSNLQLVRFPTSNADAKQLWEAVFDAALEEPRETLILLLNNIRDHLGTRSRNELERAARDIGLTI